jgi:hypothetical protein
VVNGQHTGDVVLALYLGALGLGFWAQAIRLRLARTAPTFTPLLAHVLVAAFAIALLLSAADLASGGRF